MCADSSRVPGTPAPDPLAPDTSAALDGRPGLHKMSRELQMCVVKTFSMMKTRRDHWNSTKNIGNWENKTKRGSGERKKREILAPTWTPTSPGPLPLFPGPPPAGPPPNHTPTYPNPCWWNTGGRTSWTQKGFPECGVRRGCLELK